MTVERRKAMEFWARIDTIEWAKRTMQDSSNLAKCSLGEEEGIQGKRGILGRLYDEMILLKGIYGER